MEGRFDAYVLSIAIQTEENVFDVLFPDKKGKGHGKNYPTMIIPNKDIYLDHADAGINLISQIQDFICNLNQAFFDEFCYKSKQIEHIKNLYMGLNYSGEFYQYHINDIFECSN